MVLMMTGRVLLVCALCVLWCGAAVLVSAAGDVVDGDGRGVDSGGLPESAEHAVLLPRISYSRVELQEVTNPLQKRIEKVPALAKQSSEGEDEAGEEVLLTKELTGPDEVQQTSGEEIPPPSPSPKKSKGGGPPQEDELNLRKVNELVMQPEKQRRVEEGLETIGDGEAAVTKQNEGIGVQPQDHETPVQEENTSSGEGQQPSQGKDQQTSVEDMPPRNSTGDYSSGEHNGNGGSNEKEGEEGVEGHERDRAQEREEAAHVSGAPKANSTDIQQEVQRTHAGETPTGMKQRAGEEKDDETEEEREEQKEQHQENPPGKEQETITGANATNQINTTPGESDGSTAVSHTTSPLFLLLVASAAAVVAAWE
ncbi:mucin-associated surface protein (MASP) [Trypanosoma cruzi Dm28c]|uniref:Mucin-associated surface protein (MASP) n=2 Tax=Trypanosoma cruzi TaxID=5693 RepID=V5CXB9_TRYCR|nr:mucin-associated surface protein (MASP) [Trypanosoma cruzi Dm28c]PBJ78812.1 mucin-associated surface protein [Trypanosoma cruzi cruzi]PWU90438.1 Mucin-associated surface protein (MASP) [Trypanosoma cruzi]